MVFSRGFWILFLTASCLGAAISAHAAEEAKSASPTPAGCPNIELGETAEDCPWGGAARELQTEAEAKGSLVKKLEAAAPGLFKQLKKDSKNTAMKNLWGQSINYDEYAKGIIVHPEIIASIAQVMEVSPASQPAPAASGVKGDLVHAGMEHTYGYLFSTLKTPFGYKRARWVRSIMESGFGLPSGILSPNASEGSLFSNVTYFTGKIAFRTEPEKMKAVEKGNKALSKTLKNFKYKDLKITRLEEAVNAPDTNGKNRIVILRTDFVPFTSKSTVPSNTHLLVYSINDPANGGPKLITAFPVEASFVEKALSPENLGEGKPVITRYNAYVEGLTGAKLTGSRKVKKP